MGAITVGYFAYKKYEQYKLVSSLSPQVKNTSLRLSMALSYEIENTQITYKELFDKLDSDIIEIDKKILDVKTLMTSRNSEKTEPILIYIKECQELIRAIASKYRKEFASSSSHDLAENQFNDLKTADKYSIEYAERNFKKANADFTKARDEYITSISDLLLTLVKFKNILDRVNIIMSKDDLIDVASIDAYLEKYKPPVSERLAEQEQKISNYAYSSPIGISYQKVYENLNVFFPKFEEFDIDNKKRTLSLFNNGQFATLEIIGDKTNISQVSIKSLSFGPISPSDTKRVISLIEILIHNIDPQWSNSAEFLSAIKNKDDIIQRFVIGDKAIELNLYPGAKSLIFCTIKHKNVESESIKKLVSESSSIFANLLSKAYRNKK